MERFLITGTNRGIGLALCRRLVQRGDMIFAACRQPEKADALRQLKQSYPDRLHLIPLEVTDSAAVAESVNQVSAIVDGLDVLVNNAAINPPGQSFDEVQFETMVHVFKTNTIAPFMIARAYLPLLKRGNRPRIINISSDMASLEWRTSGDDYGYCASKTALNMLTRGLSYDVKADGVICVPLDPGWVQTDMGSPDATLTPDESAQGVISVIDGLSEADSGEFLSYSGDRHPW